MDTMGWGPDRGAVGMGKMMQDLCFELFQHVLPKFHLSSGYWSCRLCGAKFGLWI